MEGCAGEPHTTRVQLSPLFTAVVTADDDFSAELLPDSFLYALLEGTNGVATSVWSYCLGFPGEADIDASVAYLEAQPARHPALLRRLPELDPYGRETCRDRPRPPDSFVRCNEERDPAELEERDSAELKAAYLKEASTWDL